MRQMCGTTSSNIQGYVIIWPGLSGWFQLLWLKKGTYSSVTINPFIWSLSQNKKKSALPVRFSRNSQIFTNSVNMCTSAKVEYEPLHMVVCLHVYKFKSASGCKCALRPSHSNDCDSSLIDAGHIFGNCPNAFDKYL